MELNKETIHKIQGLILFTVLTVAACFKFDVVVSAVSYMIGLFSPFLVGGAIAFVVNVMMRFWERHLFENSFAKKQRWLQKLRRPFSLFFSILVIFCIIIVVILFVIPELGKALSVLAVNIQSFFPRLYEQLEEIFRNNPDILHYLEPLEKVSLDWGKIISGVVNFLKNGIGSVVGSTFSFASEVAGTMFDLTISFVFSCYLLLQKEKLSVQIKKVMRAFLPDVWTERLLLAGQLCMKNFSSFITGQCVEAVILGGMFFVTLSVFKYPYALLIGVIIGFLALIPVFGAFLGCVLSVLLILTVSPFKAFTFLVIFFILQQLEESLIYPRVVGNSVGLPAIWVLVAVTVGGSLMGVLGMLIFIPLFSVFYTLFRREVYRRLNLRKAVANQKKQPVNRHRK